MAEKKPQDRKPKVETVDGVMRTKVQGIDVAIPRERFDDWDVMESLAISADAAADEGTRLVASVKMIRLLFGADFERVKAALREQNDGSLKTEVVNAFAQKVFEALNPNS